MIMTDLHTEIITEHPITRIYRILENIHGGNFCGFHGFSNNRKSFPVNHGLIDQQVKSTTMLQQKLYCNSLFLLKMQNFPLYDTWLMYSFTSSIWHSCSSNLVQRWQRGEPSEGLAIPIPWWWVTCYFP